MKQKIYTAEEAAALRNGATPGPWESESSRADSDGGLENWSCASVGACGCCSSPWVDAGDAALIEAAPDLAATVEHLYARLAEKA